MKCGYLSPKNVTKNTTMKKSRGHALGLFNSTFLIAYITGWLTFRRLTSTIVDVPHR